MTYRFLEDIAVADAAFEAWGRTLEELFIAAAEATMNVMVEDPAMIAAREQRHIEGGPDALDLLLYHLLEEIIFYKDSEQLLLRVIEVELRPEEQGLFRLRAEAWGERLDPSRHALAADVKAVTLHRFQVAPTPEGWKATVVLDI